MRSALVFFLFLSINLASYLLIGPSLVTLGIAIVLAAFGLIWTRRGTPLVFNGKVIGETRGIERLPARRKLGEPVVTTTYRDGKLVGTMTSYSLIPLRDADGDFGTDEDRNVHRITLGPDGTIATVEPMFPMSPADREEQRRSFAFGNASMSNPAITREMIDRAADEMARPLNDNGEPEMGGAA